MATAPQTRRSAEERREEILEAAREEFALRGLHGASTDAIARRAGISQPYLFRLFGTKKELYLATVRQCLAETLESFQAASGGKRGEDALHAIAERYRAVLRDNPTVLMAQMQAYAASSDPDVAAVVREGYGRLVDHVERVSGAGEEEVSRFFAAGMLMNVIASMGLMESPEPWAERLIAGCGKSEL